MVQDARELQVAVDRPVQDVNRLLKQFEDMNKLMKNFTRGGKSRLMNGFKMPMGF